jgi:hypothetical protein
MVAFALPRVLSGSLSFKVVCRLTGIASKHFVKGDLIK